MTMCRPIFVALALAICISGCSDARPLSKLVTFEIFEASFELQADMDPVQIVNLGETVYLAKSSIVSNNHVKTVSKEYSRDGNLQVRLEFTDQGAERLRAFTSAQSSQALAIVVDGHTVDVLRVSSTIGSNAVLSDLRGIDENDLFTTLTATSVTESN